MIDNNVLTANFAYSAGEGVCYPDLIKIGTTLGDGSLQSFDATDYIKFLKVREIPKAAISIEKAQTKFPSDVAVIGVSNTNISSAGKNELFCYEFECEDINNKRYLIYVNTDTGGQEKRFILLQDENETLTV